jgi:hypothetical protein
MMSMLILAVLRAQCVMHGELQDHVCTPGAVEDITLYTICTQSTKARRSVSQREHVAAFTRYGLTYPQPAGAYEVDHLVPIELGGSNDPKNLWPQPAPAFHRKDALENWMHKQVCTGEMTLADAQHQIATDWTAAYQAMMDEESE